MTHLPHITAEYQAAIRIIATALGQWYGGSPERLDARAIAIIARLASHEPPILLEMEADDDVKQRGGPRCSHCREAAADGQGYTLLHGVWLCDSCAAAEHERDRKRDEREERETT